jgi:hypothetical protein
MYCKIIEEVCRESLGEIQFLKMAANKMEGGQGLYRTLGWSRDFSRVCGEPGTGKGCFKTLKEYCENILAGSAENLLNALKVFLSGV